MSSLPENSRESSGSQAVARDQPAGRSGVFEEDAPGAMDIPNRPTERGQRQGHLTLDTFSPVNANGCFEFDRVVKSGRALKRTRKTKSWKPVFLVLRPNSISIYRDEEATRLRHQITLADLTAVARQKDPKHKAKYVFGLFSPARNFHIDANSEEEAQDWVEQIRREARIDEEEEEMILTSPGGYHADHNAARTFSGSHSIDARHIASSSSEHEGQLRSKAAHCGGGGPENRMHSARVSTTLHHYSGNEHGSYSDFSDTGFFPDSTLSLPHAGVENSDPNAADAIYQPNRPSTNRNASGISMIAGAQRADEERVIYHGWLFLLKSKGGVRQWKSLWCVLRPKSLILYKNEEEYSALLILPFPQIVNAVEIDAQSKSRKYCFQVITEERNWRFCAMGEEELAKWLGALKSLLAKRKEKEVWEKEEERLKERLTKEKGKGVELKNIASATTGGSRAGGAVDASIGANTILVATVAASQQPNLPLR